MVLGTTGRSPEKRVDLMYQVRTEIVKGKPRGRDLDYSMNRREMKFNIPMKVMIMWRGRGSSFSDKHKERTDKVSAESRGLEEEKYTRQDNLEVVYEMSAEVEF